MSGTQWLDPIIPTRGVRVDAGMYVSLAWRVPNKRGGRPFAALCFGRVVLSRLGWAAPMQLIVRPSADGRAILLEPARAAMRGYALGFKENVATVTIPLRWVTSDVQKAAHVEIEVMGDRLAVTLPAWAWNRTAAGGGQAAAPAFREASPVPEPKLPPPPILSSPIPPPPILLSPIPPAPAPPAPALTRAERDKAAAKNLFDGGWGGREIAEDLLLPLGTVSNWVAQWREERKIAAQAAAAERAKHGEAA